ncbi:MAG: NADH-quinone oxidoreductase subunit NuoD [Candidatus Omnitrophica bacterium CG11_big_fil_rev_8_21_14_0_20_63_9]|nr:MAG: NADH-quinone oxidoreductase subunit NuoD [Candidatus Omnitrophica bacterium CG11_big_fil_rev_8_21_14_0_20_63_9]
MSATTAETQLLEINLGPQHPSTHGVFRMIATLDGETIVKLKPVMGYLHRNHEQIGEGITYVASFPFTDRLDYFNAMSNNFGLALAIEKLGGIQASERGEYVRVIMAELTRLVNHVAVTGFLLNDMGAFGTPLLYAFRERERILDLFEAASGSRMMCNYVRPGGVREDVPVQWLERAREIVNNFPIFLDEFETLLTENEIIQQRAKHVGVLPKTLAVNASITGPMARASGVNYDIRKVDGYSIYPKFAFKVPLGSVGDVYDRYYVRILEMRESVKILQQALKDIPGGPAISPKGQAISKAPRTFKPPKGEAYGRVESPKGELGFYLVSDGSSQPYRYHIRAPSFINLTVLEDMCLGQKVADAIIILGSIDIVLGEVDR